MKKAEKQKIFTFTAKTMVGKLDLSTIMLIQKIFEKRIIVTFFDRVSINLDFDTFPLREQIYNELADALYDWGNK